MDPIAVDWVAAYREAAAWTMLLGVMIGGVRGWFVFGHHYRRECKKNDETLGILFELSGLAGKAVDVARRSRESS